MSRRSSVSVNVSPLVWNHLINLLLGSSHVDVVFLLVVFFFYLHLLARTHTVINFPRPQSAISCAVHSNVFFLIIESILYGVGPTGPLVKPVQVSVSSPLIFTSFNRFSINPRIPRMYFLSKIIHLLSSVTSSSVAF